MKFKLQHTAAKNDDVSGRDKLRREIAEFISEANEAAIALYTISNVCMSLFGAGKLQHDIASKLMAISTTLTMLSALIDLDSDTVLYPHDVELLSKSVDTCRPLIHKITTSAQRLDSHLSDEPRAKGVGAQARFNAFNKGEEEGPLRTLDDCLRVLMGIIMIARTERLSHRDTLYVYSRLYHLPAYLPNRTDGESSEALRFHLALLHNEKFPESTQRGLHFTPENNAPGHINTSSPFKSSLPFEPTPLCIQQPPFPPPQTQSSLFPHFDFPPSLSESTRTPPAFTMDTFRAHMETYILRPQVHSINNSSIMTYHIEPIHLEEGDMRAHVAKQSSIVNIVAQLLPDQLRIIQERVKERKGELVSALFGADVDLITQMGTLRTKAVVFVLKTRAEKVDEGKQEGKQYACWGAKVDTPAPPPSSASLFAGLPFTTSAPPPPAPGFPATSMGRDGSKPQVLGGPGFFREEEGFFGGMQEYMSVTTSDAYKDKSFEELRVADYQAGRTKNGDVKPVSKPDFPFAKNADTSKPMGLFGQQLGNASGAAASCFFGQSTSTPAPGLLGQDNSTPASGLTGQPTATQAPSLFAKPTPPTSAFTFGFKSTPVSDGLGNKSGTPFTSGGLFSGPSVAELTKQLSPMDVLCLDFAEKVKFDATDDAIEENPLTQRHDQNLGAFGENFIAHKEDVELKEKAERKQKMKEKDFDPNHESEEVWSARYGRLERYRIDDAQKPPKVPDTIYAVDTDGVAWVRPNPPPADLDNPSAGVAPVVSTNPFTALAPVASDASTASAFRTFSNTGTGSTPADRGLGEGSKDTGGDAGESGGKKEDSKE